MHFQRLSRALHSRSLWHNPSLSKRLFTFQPPLPHRLVSVSSLVKHQTKPRITETLMPIQLKGSCHCGAVKFSLQSSTPVPYQLCLCSICRKVGGVGGSINLGGYSNTLKIEGKENISVYKAVLNRGTPKEKIASSERNFCSKCSSMLWLYDPTWPELIHPFASAIDSHLESPKTMTCIKLDSKPEYVRLPEGDKEVYDGYGPESIESWHKKHYLFLA